MPALHFKPDTQPLPDAKADSGSLLRPKCPCCGSPDFTFIQAKAGFRDGPAIAALHFVMGMDSPSTACGPGWYHPVYVKRCASCGYIGFFDREIVDEMATRVIPPGFQTP